MRIRVTQSELTQVIEHGRVIDAVEFGGGAALRYQLIRDPNGSAVDASFTDNVLTVTLPSPIADEWAGSEQVSIDAQQGLNNGDSLAILVEKDFACLAPREGENDADMFPNPGTDTGAGC